MSDRTLICAVSDSLGATAEVLAEEAAGQFDCCSVEIRRYPYVNGKEILNEIVAQARKGNGLIIYLLANRELRRELVRLAGESRVPAIDLLEPVVSQIARLTGCRPLYSTELLCQHDHQADRITEAINFAIRYDDGKDKAGLLQADIVLIGISRTSKTPISLYLAQKGIKVANLPLIPEAPWPEELFKVPAGQLIGLTIKWHSLNQIRQVRLRTLGLTNEAEYASLMRIQKEIAYADSLMEQLGCPVIDITYKAVEEASGEILQIYYRGREGSAKGDVYGST